VTGGAADWDAALASALAGTARQPLPRDGAATDRADPAGELLSVAARLATRRLAGWTPPRVPQPAATADPAPPEEDGTVPPAAAGRLAAMLAGDGAELLAEWLDLAGGRRLIVPPRLLPALLDHAGRQAAAREPVLAVIGRRGRWLAGQVPGWAFAAVADPDAAYETGARPARAAALRELRRRDPGAALRRLAAGWPGESGEDRAALIGCLEVGLGPADEELLEAARRDSRREVRQAALGLLARLPASGLVARMRERVLPLVVHRRTLLRGRLAVAAPERCDAGMVADGIEARPPSGTGERAWWLQQMLGMVPPATWPVEVVDAAADSEWAAPLLRGWAVAAGRFRDAAWAGALVGLWARLPEKRRDELALAPDELVAELGRPDRDAIVLGVLGRSPVDGVRLAARCDHRWGRELTTAVLQRLPELVARHGHPVAQVATLARQAGLRGDPAAQPEAERLAARETGVPWLDGALADAAATLRRRALMAKELS
jgi:hypothetical protein